jgi:hypothetical protein
MKKTIQLYAIEGFVAGILVYFSIKLFLVYFFMNWLIKSFKNNELIRKILVVNNFLQEVKLRSILEKLSINHEDVCLVHDGLIESLRKEHQEILSNLEKAANDLGLDINK